MADMAALSNMPESSPATQSPNSSETRRNRRRGRGGARTFPDRGTNPALQERTVTGGRSFGGQLTRLHADAPAFVPASVPPPPADQPRPQPSKRRPPSQKPVSSDRPIPIHTPSVQKKDPQTRRRGSLLRSTAPDISTRTHEDIGRGVYE